MQDTPSHDAWYTGFNEAAARELKPFCGNTKASGELRLATTSPDSHLNIIVAKNGEHRWVCISPDDARWLRDRMLEAYPIEQATPLPPVRYAKTTNDTDGVRVERVYFKEARECVARYMSHADAEVLIDALIAKDADNV